MLGLSFAAAPTVTIIFHIFYLPFISTCSDYYNSMDLHIGVTTSTGAIVEFDRCGLRRRQRHPDDTRLPQNSTLHQSSMKNSSSNRSSNTTTPGSNVVGGSGYSKWNQSLLVEQVPEEWCEHWDAVLEEVSITSTYH